MNMLKVYVLAIFKVNKEQKLFKEMTGTLTAYRYIYDIPIFITLIRIPFTKRKEY